MSHLTKTKFVIWFEGRSGSSHLVSLLNDHRDILCRGENFDAHVFVNSEGASKSKKSNLVEFNRKFFCRRLANFEETVLGPTEDQVLKHLGLLLNWKRQANGFKFKHPRQSELYPEECRELLKSRRELRVIHLTRNNLVKRAISKQNQARIRSMYGTANLREQAKLEKLTVDIQELIDYCDRADSRKQRFMDWPKQFANVLEIEYDDLLNDQQSVINRAFQFLRVEFQKVESKRFKATPNKISDAVENYGQLKKVISKTKYSEFLTED